MMSFMMASLGCWVCQTKKAVLFRGIFLRAVCCSDTQGWLGFPWPPKRGWAKTCATLPWPLRGWSLQFVFAVLTPRSQSKRANVKAAQHRAERGLALTQERAEITLRGLPRTANRSGQRQARGAAPERRRPPTPPRPWEAFHSVPLRGTQPGSKRPIEQQSVTAGRGLGVPNPQGMRQPTPALPGASVPCLHAQCLRPTSQVCGELSRFPQMVLQSYG